MKKNLVIATSCLLVAASSAQAFTNSPSEQRWRWLKWVYAASAKLSGRITGHEEITRQSLNIVADKLHKVGIDPESRGVKEFLADREPQLEMNGFRTKNLIVQGNYATDFPEGIYSQVQIPKYLGKPDGVNWDTWDGVQPSHTLTYPLETGVKSKPPRSSDHLVSQQDLCYESRARIMETTVDAAQRWELGERKQAAAEKIPSTPANKMKRDILTQQGLDLKKDALFLLGHATHTIQDSFSPAHVARDTWQGNNDPLNIGYYGSDLKNHLTQAGVADQVAYHETVDIGDFIWIRDEANYRRTRREWMNIPGEKIRLCSDTILKLPADKEACLKHEARLARNATVRYLFVVAKYLNEKRTGKIKDTKHDELVTRLTQNFFEGNAGIPGNDEVMPDGIMRCHRLSDKVVPRQEGTILNVIGEIAKRNMSGARPSPTSGINLSIHKALGLDKVEAARKAEEDRREQRHARPAPAGAAK